MFSYRQHLIPQMEGVIKKSLYAIALSLMISIFVAVNYLKTASDSVTKSQNEAIWFVLQLTKEYSEFIYELKTYQHQPNNYNQVLIQYEILWSRFGSFLNNSEVTYLRDSKNIINEVFIQFERLKMLESDVVKINQANNIHMLIIKFRENFESLMVTFNREFHLNKGEHKNTISSISLVEKIIRFLIVATIIVGIFLSYLLFKDVRTNRRLAMYDSLTALNNRLWLNQKLATLEYKQTRFNFYLIDLDGFKAINDTYGHHVGDEFLRGVSNQLRNLTNSKCFAARMGGDEFAFIEILKDDQGTCSHSPIATKLSAALQTTLAIAGVKHTISASVGVSQYPTYAQNVSQLLKQADTAMYDAKDKGKNRITYFSKNYLKIVSNDD